MLEPLELYFTNNFISSLSKTTKTQYEQNLKTRDKVKLGTKDKRKGAKKNSY